MTPHPDRSASTPATTRRRKARSRSWRARSAARRGRHHRVGGDGNPEAAESIKKGLLLCTAANVPQYMGAMMATRIYDVMNGWRPRAAERMMLWGSRMMTAENVDGYLERYVTTATWRRLISENVEGNHAEGLGSSGPPDPARRHVEGPASKSRRTINIRRSIWRPNRTARWRRSPRNTRNTTRSICSVLRQTEEGVEWDLGPSVAGRIVPGGAGFEELRAHSNSARRKLGRAAAVYCRVGRRERRR